MKLGSEIKESHALETVLNRRICLGGSPVRMYAMISKGRFGVGGCSCSIPLSSGLVSIKLQILWFGKCAGDESVLGLGVPGPTKPSIMVWKKKS